MRDGVIIKTVINGMIFDGQTKDPIQQAVRDALIAFMAAMAEAAGSRHQRSSAGRNCRRKGQGSDLPRSEAQLQQEAAGDRDQDALRRGRSVSYFEGDRPLTPGCAADPCSACRSRASASGLGSVDARLHCDLMPASARIDYWVPMTTRPKLGRKLPVRYKFAFSK